MPGREPGDEDIDCTSKSSSRKFVPRNSGGSSSSKLRPAGFVATRGIAEAGEGRGLRALRQRESTSLRQIIRLLHDAFVFRLGMAYV